MRGPPEYVSGIGNQDFKTAALTVVSFVLGPVDTNGQKSRPRVDKSSNMEDNKAMMIGTIIKT
jgi:hypothetical protein